MQIVIISVGKQLRAGIKELADEYTKRLAAELTITFELIPPIQHQSTHIQRSKESDAIRAKLRTGDSVMLLDERGKQFDNTELAAKLDSLLGQHGRVVVIVGGAYGVDEALRAQATVVWSLSHLVFPHQLVYVMLLEQLYRSRMVHKGHPYHHA